jgi:hypothetical protein
VAALAFGLLALAVGVPSASAVDPFPTTGEATLSSLNFTVHYSRDDRSTTCTNYITQEKAGDILGMLERARTFYLGMGLSWPAPNPDTDSHIHVSIDDFEDVCIVHGAIPFGTPLPFERWDAIIEPIAPGTDNIHLNVHSGLTYPAIAHEMFHLVEDATASNVDPWLAEATAEWASTRANNAASGTETNPDRTLDCVGAECGDTEYDRNGYPGWMLIEYLSERYKDDGKVRALWTWASTNGGVPGATGLATVIDVSLATFYNDYANKRLTGDFTFAPLKGVLPETIGTIVVGNVDGKSDDLNVAVNHFAARYLTFKHGTNTGACFEATLTINVAIPAGVESHPAYYANTVGAAAQPLTISGTNASITVPWNTCSDSPNAYLSLPNGTAAPDGQEFVVNASVKVDTTKPATATAPPPGAHVIGTVVPVPTTDPAPTLKIYAPEVLRVSAKTRLLRFVVFSSGDGKLNATLGSTNLGASALRGGNNDVRFVLPTQVFKSLRAKTSSNVLQLTSQSPSGTKGATFTRHVVVQAAPKKKIKKR